MNNKEFFTDRGYEIQAGKDALTPSMEDYLEMVTRLSNGRGYTRVNELADNLNVKPASVTKMVRNLCDKSYLHYERYGLIQLTDKGKQYGQYLLKRHQLLEDFFRTFGATGDLQRQVERIEHHISFENYQNLALLLEFFRQKPDLLDEFYQFKDKNTAHDKNQENPLNPE